MQMTLRDVRIMFSVRLAIFRLLDRGPEAIDSSSSQHSPRIQCEGGDSISPHIGLGISQSLPAPSTLAASQTPDKPGSRDPHLLSLITE